VTFQLSGDHLEPDEVSAAMGLRPTTSARSGGPVHSALGDKQGPAKTGLWSIRSEWSDNQTLDEKIRRLFADLTPDTATWHNLVREFSGRLLCHVERQSNRQGLRLSAETVTEIADRGLALDVIIEA